MKFLRHLLGITKLDKEKNKCIREKTGAQNIVKEIKQYQEKWLQHVQRMDTNRIPKQSLQCKPKGRRNIGRPRKRWRDQFHFEDQGTGNTSNPSWTWWWWWWWWWANDYTYCTFVSITPWFHDIFGLVNLFRVYSWLLFDFYFTVFMIVHFAICST